MANVSLRDVADCLGFGDSFSVVRNMLGLRRLESFSKQSVSVAFVASSGIEVLPCRVFLRNGNQFESVLTENRRCTASPCLLTVDADDVELTSRLRLAVVTPDGRPRVAVGDLQHAHGACGSSTAANPLVLLGLGDDGFEAAFTEVFE